MKPKKMDWRILVWCILIVYLVAWVGSTFTSSSINKGWYNSIRPEITPPNYVFPIVWNILFLLIAISLYLAWTSSKDKNKPKIAWLFGINLFLNTLWSFLFFRLQKPGYAFYDLILLDLSIIVIILETWKTNKKSSILLIPYLLWVTFAGYLNWLVVVG